MIEYFLLLFATMQEGTFHIGLSHYNRAFANVCTIASVPVTSTCPRTFKGSTPSLPTPR